jgi:CheY-like chemotaxis protein
MFEQMGHTVVGVERGAEVLEALRRERFDVVFMDIRMPDMDGVETTRRIRSLDGDAPPVENRNVPVVALTAHAMAGDRERFLRAGMSDYLAKPVEITDLAAVLERVLG